MDVGRVCIKLTGRESGKKCVIVDIIDRNYVLISGPEELTGLRRRRAKMRHLQPLDEKLEITRGASDEEIMEFLSNEKEK